MDGQTGMIILYILLGFFGLIVVAGGTTLWVLLRRRKYIYTYFLDDTGQWSRESWMPQDMKENFNYNGNTYKFDIKKCTRDRLNRPTAHYYVGNPEQQIFDFSQKNKKIPLNVGTQPITSNDFNVLMLSKVLRDIFQDEEVMNMLWIILISLILCAVAVIIFVKTHNPPVTLEANNETISVIKQAVSEAIKGAS